MKVLVAMDSFKGSLTSLEAGEAVREGIRRACKGSVTVRPAADGGEGTAEALTEGLGGTYRYVWVKGPLGAPARARYGMLPDGETAVMEMAQAAGMTLAGGKPDPWKATSYGVGEMILDALRQGARKFIIGIGGSASSDGGAGMLQALGYEFLDHRGREIGPGIGSLDKISRIRSDRVDQAGLRNCCFQIACDVANPLLGEQGAVFVYGPQKGVREEEKEILDAKMRHFAELTREFTGRDESRRAGAGAAGGLGFACLSYLPGVRLRPGTDIVFEAVRLEEEVKKADLVVTGEGCLDGQTVMGKVPIGVAKLAGKWKKRTIAFGGMVTEEARLCNEHGIDACFSILGRPMTLEEAMDRETARRNLAFAAEQVFRLAGNSPV